MLNFLKKVFINSERENIELIRKSKYFDEKYYLSENPNLKGDPCRHYYYYGWKEGKSPSFDFSNNFYLKNYKDVKDSGINPLVHYIKYGKAENRIISKENGLSLKKMYEKAYGCAYFYKTYINDINLKRVNMFFDDIDGSVNDLCQLFEYIIKFCNNYNYCLRIVYFNADFEILKEFLKNNNINLPTNTIFLKLKSSNYLEVGSNEKYICASWKTARALLNTVSINSTIYYYLPDNINSLPKEEYYQISNICMNTHVVVMAKSKDIIDSLKGCFLKFEISNLKLEVKDINQLYCDFGEMFIVGIELLDRAFLSGVLKKNDWSVKVLEWKKYFNFHFETNVSIRKVYEFDECADFVFSISYDKKKVSYNKPYISAWVEEKKINYKNFILIEDENYQKMLEIKDFSISTIDSYFKNFEKCILKLIDKR